MERHAWRKGLVRGEETDKEKKDIKIRKDGPWKGE
jgi:hypothetical protein